MKKPKKIGIVITLCILAAVIITIFGYYWISHSEQRKYESIISNYEVVNESVEVIASSDEYSNAEAGERAEQMLDALETLESEGSIKKDSVNYNEETELISYQYADGAYGGVMLVDFEEGTSGTISGSYEASSAYDAETGRYNFENWPSVPVFDTDIIPYEEGELRALIVCDFEEEFVDMSQAQQSAWNEVYLTTDVVSDGTVDFFRTGLDGYDYVSIQEHGVIYEGVPIIVLQETANVFDQAEKWLGITFSEEEKENLDDMQANRLAQIHMTDGKCHYCLLPDFITYYYGDEGGLLDGSFIWLGCCSGFENEALVKAFADSGAKAVLGCTEKILIAYGFMMQDAFVYKLLSGYSVSDSLAFAQSYWGENDAVFIKYYSGKDDDTPAEIRYYNGGDETLATLKETITEKVEIDEIIFQSTYEGYYEFAVVTAYDESGQVVWEYTTPQYEAAELDRVSDIGQKDDQYFLIQDGSVISLDVQTGNILWENSDFGGSESGVAFGEDALYLCGYYGPDFYAVSYEGETVYRIEQFYESYYWAYQIELQDNYAVVYMEGGMDGGLDPVKIYVDLNTGEYGRNQSGDTDDALILGTWYNEAYDSDWLAGQYATEFFEDGTVVCTGMRETDNGTYEVSSDNTTIYAAFNENYYYSSETGQSTLTEGYEYTVVYTYDTDQDMLYAEYGDDFYTAAMSIGNGSGYLHR